MKIIQNYLCKRAFRFNRAPLFNKRALRSARRAGQGRIPSNQKLFLILLILIKKKKIFWKRALLNEVFDPRTVFLPEIGPVIFNIAISADGTTLYSNVIRYPQHAITCSKLTIEKLEQGVKFVQS